MGSCLKKVVGGFNLWEINDADKEFIGKEEVINYNKKIYNNMLLN